MAETYARMDKASADGMKTADAAVAAVVDGWARVRDDSSGVNFCGLLDGPANARKFYHLLYVGADVGIIKRNKAQLQKAAVFNAMPGTAGEVQLPADAKTPERLAELLV